LKLTKAYRNQEEKNMKRKILSTLVMALAIFTFFPVFGLCAGENLVKNPGFEEMINGVPMGWKNSIKVGVSVNIDESGHTGSKSLHIKNSVMADTMVTQNLSVKKGKTYKVSGWVRADIKNQPGSANITLFYDSILSDKGIYTSKELRNTNGQWEKIEFSIKTRNDIDDPLTIALRLGGQGIENEGEVYFDDIEVVEIDENEKLPEHFEFNASNAAESSNTENIQKNNTENPVPTSNQKKGAPSLLWIIIVLAGCSILLFRNNIFTDNNTVEEELKHNDNKTDDNKKGSFFDKDI